jgi:hypothetical protein
MSFSAHIVSTTQECLLEESPPLAPSVPELIGEVRRLRAYCVVSWAALAVFALAAFQANPRYSEHLRVTELTTERLNVVGPDGRSAVVIANATRLPGNVMNGRERREGRRGAGLIFYNGDGNEAGGLILDSNRQGDSLVQAFGQLSLDRFESDQVAALRYVESATGWEAGLQVSHYPRSSLAEWHLALDSIDRLSAPAVRDSARRALRRRFFREGKWEVPRLFAGERGRTAAVELRDMRGRERVRLSVDSLGTAKLEFLDSTGVVTARLPER